MAIFQMKFNAHAVVAYTGNVKRKDESSTISCFSLPNSLLNFDKVDRDSATAAAASGNKYILKDIFN